MKAPVSTLRPEKGSSATPYVYRTRGVCPGEIHFALRDGHVEGVRFVGGGCPGNAELVARLLEGRPVEAALGQLDGIACRGNASCPDQLARALSAARDGSLPPAASLRTATDAEARRRVGLVGAVDGRAAVLEAVLAALRTRGAEAVYCVGGLTHPEGGPDGLEGALHRGGVLALAGDQDAALPGLPHLISFRLGDRPGVAFFGENVLDRPGFSDFAPFALEMNMVCRLTRFMADPSVFSALEAMTAQFTARLVVFGQPRAWGQWTVGKVDFISVGPALQPGQLTWGVLELRDGEVRLGVETAPWTEDQNHV